MAATTEKPIPGHIKAVDHLPVCEWCITSVPAEFDFKTHHGPWAYACNAHYVQNRLYPDTGFGKGQKLIHREVNE